VIIAFCLIRVIRGVSLWRCRQWFYHLVLEDLIAVALILRAWARRWAATLVADLYRDQALVGQLPLRHGRLVGNGGSPFRRVVGEAHRNAEDVRDEQLLGEDPP
jgi:hypothetical protein